MSIFEIIAEKRIEQAIAEGAFDNLQNKVKPLANDNMDHVPEEMRMAYKILKNAGIIPEEIELKKGIVHISNLLDSCTNENEKKELRMKLNEKQLRYNIIMESRGLRKIDPAYENKIYDRLK